MLLTEKEAAEKWCPHARCSANSDEPSANRYAYPSNDPGVFAQCIGSRCMQWRWDVSVPPGDGPLVRSDTGFCGLAGTPLEAL